MGRQVGENNTQTPQGSGEQTSPLSLAQERLWLFEQGSPHTATYNLPCLIDLRGPLNRTILLEAINTLVARHEPLRTSFPALEGRPVQRISPLLTIDLPSTDLQGWPGSEREAEALRRATTEALRPFDLETGPLMRACLLDLGSDRHFLLFTFHHSIFDGWSSAIFLHELATVYQAKTTGGDALLPALPLTYSAYAESQRTRLADPAQRDRLIAYWRPKLARVPTVLDVWGDRRPPPAQSFRGRRIEVPVPDSLTQAIRALGRRERVTTATTLLAAFAMLLSRHSGQEDMIVGVPVAGRSQPNLEQLVGFFVEMQPIRVTLPPSGRFVDLLSQVRTSLAEAHQYQDLPFQHLVELLQPARAPGRSPLVQVSFAYQNSPEPMFDAGDLVGNVVKLMLPVAKFDLTLEVLDRRGEIDCFFEYATDLVPHERVVRLSRHWLTLLGRIVESPESRLSALSVPPRAEQRRVFVDWNATETPYPPADSFIDLFDRQVRSAPNAPALADAHHTLSYREVDRRSSQVAELLRRRQIGTEHIVSLYMDRSAHAIVSMLGILKAGAAFLPIDAPLPQRRFISLLQAAGSVLVVTQPDLAHHCAASGLPYLVLDSAPPLDGVAGEHALAQRRHPSQLAYVIFTSGSTGRPKGVAVAHQGLVNLVHAQAAAFGVTGESRVLQFASLSFDASVAEIAVTLGSGACLCLAPREQLLPGDALARTVRRLAISHLTVPPSLLDVADPATLPPGRVVIAAGEALSAATASRWAERHEVINAYGPTETTVCATVERYQRGMPLTIGRPIANTRVYLLDAERQPVPIGACGELYIGGVGLARGYLRAPELTAQRFIPDPFSRTPGARLYQTGDRGRHRENGTIEFLGRIDDQLKIRGYRVEPAEIEAVLRQHPAVQQSAVRLRGRDGGEASLLALVVLLPPHVLDPPLIDDVVHHLRQSLPEYMIPASFVQLDSLPTTTSGKIDRRRLPEADPREQPRGHQAYEPPRSWLEEQIASIWRETLAVPSVGLHDNFFDLGGHSLLAVVVQQRLTELTQRSVDLTVLFEHTTVQTLASALSHRSAADDQTARRQNPAAAGQRGVQTDQMRKQLLARMRQRTNKK